MSRGDHASSDGDSARLRRHAAIASLSLALALTLGKLAATLASGSLAVVASLIDSLGDVVASSITFLSVRISLQPPDRGHRFGHGKAEALSALAQAALVMGTGVLVVVDAIQRLGAPRPVTAAGPVILVMAVAIVGTLALVAFQLRVVRRTGSQAIAADSLHYRADLVTNLSVILSILAATQLGWLWVDPTVAVAIAGYLAISASSIARGAVKTLMDHELPTAQRERVKAIVLAHHEVSGLHDLRTREAGATVFIELHVELDSEMTVAAAHDITDALEQELARAFPGSEVLIHQEPAGVDDQRLDHLIAGRPRETAFNP